MKSYGICLSLSYISVIYSTLYPTMLSQKTRYLSFLWLIFLCVCVCVCVCVCNFSIHASIDGHLSCYHMLDIINNELSSHKSFWISVMFSSNKYSKSVFARLYGSYVNFWGTIMLFFMMTVPFWIPTDSAQEVPPLHP